jgi:hypothetical protein
LASIYSKLISDILMITPQRASLVEGYLRLQFGTLSALSHVDIRREYHSGGANSISAVIDADVESAIRLAKSFGCLVA